MAAAAVPSIVQRFLRFVDASPSPFHAVDTAASLLEESGFKRLLEGTPWKGELKPGGRYYFTRNASTIVAFSVGGQYRDGNGFRVIGAHTDSPCLKLKPQKCDFEKEKYCQVGVQLYGGGLWYTWFDRDLKVAGRVIVRDEKEEEGKKGGSLQQKLVHINAPILRVPSLCIHMNRTVNTEGFKFNTETELVPVVATTLGGPSQEEGEEKKRSSVLLEALARELGVSSSSIVDYDLCLADCQPSTVGGVHNDFIFAPRLDNLMSSFVALDGMINSLPSLGDDSGVRMCVLFDNEEIGSTSYAGANSSLIDTALSRVSSALANEKEERTDENIHITYRNSFLLSADMAHAVHPNYSSRHEPNYKPRIHEGLVIKENANMRYATTAATAAPLRELARRHNVPIQEFVIRNDTACGSTIGPMLSSRGLRTLDVGQPQLAMHSIREMGGVPDLISTQKLYSAFFTHEFVEIDQGLRIDG